MSDSTSAPISPASGPLELFIAFALISVYGFTVLTAPVTYTIRLNPLWIFACAALLGLAGLI